MAPERYAGAAGELQRKQDEEANSGAAQAEVRRQRRNLISQLPYGRALDMEDLAYKLDQGSMDNKSIVFRQAVLDDWRRNLPGGVVLASQDVERLLAAAAADPKGLAPVSEIPQWPPAR